MGKRKQTIIETKKVKTSVIIPVFLSFFIKSLALLKNIVDGKNRSWHSRIFISVAPSFRGCVKTIKQMIFFNCTGLQPGDLGKHPFGFSLIIK